MTELGRTVLVEALDLSETERADIAAELLASLHQPDEMTVDEIERTLDLALRRRVPGSPLTDLDDVRRVPVRRFPCQLVFLTSSDEIVVVAMMHERRRPTYWIDRLDK